MSIQFHKYDFLGKLFPEVNSSYPDVVKQKLKEFFHSFHKGIFFCYSSLELSSKNLENGYERSEVKSLENVYRKFSF